MIRNFVGATPAEVERLSQFGFRLSRPTPLIWENVTQYSFPVSRRHPDINRPDEALASFDDSLGFSVHWVTELIFKMAGDTLALSESDRQELDESFSHLWGESKYSSVDDLIGEMAAVWSEIAALYPNPSQLEDFRDKIATRDRIALVEVVPDWLTEKTRDELWLDEWFIDHFNLLEPDRLESARYPGIGPSLAQAIVGEREAGGDFADAADVRARVSGVGSTVEATLAAMVARGVLSFERQQ